MHTLIVAVVLASQPTLSDSPRLLSGARLLEQDDVLPATDPAQLVAMRQEIDVQLRKSGGPAPLVLALVAIPNLGSGAIFAFFAAASGGTSFFPILLTVAVVRIGIAVALWVGSAIWTWTRANERKALEATRKSLDARLLLAQ
jgi:hypothetical protein